MGKLGVKSEALSGSIPPFQNEARDLVDGNRLTQQIGCGVRAGFAPTIDCPHHLGD